MGWDSGCVVGVFFLEFVVESPDPMLDSLYDLLQITLPRLVSVFTSIKWV